MIQADKIKVLFVCMGNICRSPTAYGVFYQLVRDRGLAQRFEIDSAGTHTFHLNKAPDPRAQAAARKRNLDIAHLRARRVAAEDFAYFDYILSMDRDNYQDLLELCPREHEYKLRLFMEFAPELKMEEVPDPYYGGPNGFERVLDMVETAAAGLFTHICRERSLDVVEPAGRNQ